MKNFEKTLKSYPIEFDLGETVYVPKLNSYDVITSIRITTNSIMFELKLNDGFFSVSSLKKI